MRLVLSLITAGLVVAATASASASDTALDSPDLAQTRQIGTRTSTDQTVTVQKGMRIDMTGTSGCNGFVTVRTWDRDAVRVRASHNSRTSVRITPRDQVLLVRTDATGPVSVDYELTVPHWIGFSAGSPWCSLDIDGLTGPVVAESVEGDIDLKNVSGTVSANSVEGAIRVDGGKGRLELRAVEGDVVVANAGGEIVAESIEGAITLKNVQATAVELSSVEGTINFLGSFAASGRYLFTTHEGDIRLVIPENSNATLTTRTFSGGKIDSTIPLKAVSSTSRNRRAVYTIGNGSAQVELETFEGAIVVRKPGEPQK